MRRATFLNGLIVFARAQPTCLPQNSGELTTQVEPKPEEDILQPCHYNLLLPELREPVRAVWVIFDRGPDHMAFYQSRQVRAFAGARQLAMVLALHCRSKDREDMDVDPAKGVGRALLTALDQFGPTLRHGPNFGRRLWSQWAGPVRVRWWEDSPGFGRSVF